MLKTNTFKSLNAQQFQRAFNESRVELAIRHRRMADDGPHMVRRWQDGQFVVVAAKQSNTQH